MALLDELQGGMQFSRLHSRAVGCSRGGYQHMKDAAFVNAADFVAMTRQ